MTPREEIVSSLVIRLDRAGVELTDRAVLSHRIDEQLQAPDLAARVEVIWAELGGQATPAQWNRLVADVRKGIQARRLEAVVLGLKAAS